jgi:hypothetical protein
MPARCLIALLVLFAGLPAKADTGSGFEMTPFAGYRMGGQIDAEDAATEIRLDDAGSFGLLLNGPYGENTQWELHYSSQATHARVTDGASGEEGAVDFDAHMLQLGGTYLFDGETVVPYLAFTLGGTHIRTRGADSEDDTFFSGSIGLGLRIWPESRVGLRVEVRAYGTLVDSKSDIFCISAPADEVAGCAVRLAGDIASQVETFAGLTIRF